MDAPLRPCVVPRCTALVVKGRCSTHAVQQDVSRPNADIRRWYHLARWKHPTHGLRAQVLQLYPLCVDCMARGEITPSTEADHEVPHRGDPILFWSLANLRGRCKPCHSAKTQAGQ